MERCYKYVGPKRIERAAAGSVGGRVVGSAVELREVVYGIGRRDPGSGPLWATFVIDPSGRLLLADRRSEHVACASGREVLSAGEMAFALEGDTVVVEQVTNQSTGYCPEPESWISVARALDAIAIPHPGSFTPAFVFRRCPACGQANIIKDDGYVCAVCGMDLPTEWNF